MADGHISGTDGPPRKAMTPSGINHLVINVRDHRGNRIGFLDRDPRLQAGRRIACVATAKMRFLQAATIGGPDEPPRHIAPLRETRTCPAPPAELGQCSRRPGRGQPHCDFRWPSREAWLKQLAFLRQQGCQVSNRRVNHGMTHSLLHQRTPNGYGVEVLL